MRLLRWMLYLQQYQFTITHCKGSDNHVADYFSRYFGPNVVCNDRNFVLNCITSSVNPHNRIRFKSVNVLSLDKEFTRELRKISEAQSKDNVLQKMQLKPPKGLKF